MTHVLVTFPFSENCLAKIRAVSPQIELETIDIGFGGWPEARKTMAEVIYGFGAIPADYQSPALRWVQLHSAGVNHLLEATVWDRDVLLTTTSGIHAATIAQYVLTQMLLWSNRVPTWRRLQAKGTWPKDRWDHYLPTELRGQTVGVLGYGSIGREVARIAKAMGMTVLVTKRDGRHIEDNGYRLPGTGDPDGSLPDRIYPTEATRSMLAACDYVVLTLPLTPKTHHLVNEELLKEMKPTSYLINIGRGSLVNESDLIKALKKGWIGGAGIDVFEQEPLPDSSPLWRLDNVNLTPHVSGFTPLYDERASDVFCSNLRRYIDGETLLNTVNRKEGY